MADPTVKVKITTDNKALFDGLKDSTSGIKKWASQGSADAKSLGSVISNLKSPFLAVASIIGGITGLKKLADDSAAWALQSNKLAKSLGVSVQQGSAWAVACKQLTIDQDSLLGVSAKLHMLVASGSEKFGKWGISVRDASGHVKSNGTLIQEMSNKYNALPNDIDKATMCADLFGKKQDDLKAVFKATSEKLAEATAKAKAYGLEVDENGVAKAKEFKESQANLGLVMTAIGNIIGKEVMPMLTAFGKFVGQEGPSMVGGLMQVIKALTVTFLVLKATIENIVTVLTAVVDGIIIEFETLGKVIWAVAHGDLKGALQAVKDGYKEVKAEGEAMAEGLAESWKKVGQGTKDLYADAPAAKKTEEPKTGNLGGSSTEQSESEQARLQKNFEGWKYNEEKKTALAGQYRQVSTAEEISWLQGNISRYNLNAKEKDAINKQLLQLQRKDLQDKFQASQANLDLEIAAHKGNFAQQIELEKQKAKATADFYGQNSAQAAEAAKKVVELEHQQVQEVKRVGELKLEASRAHSLALVALEEQGLQDKIKHSELSNLQILQAEMQFENQRYQLALQSLQDRLKLKGILPSEEQKILNDIEALNDAHNLRMAEKNKQLATELKSNNPFEGFQEGIREYLSKSKNLFSDFKSFALSITSTLQQVFSTSLQGIIKGQMNLSQAMTSLYRSMRDMVIKSIADMIAKKMAEWILDKTISVWKTADKTKTVAENGEKSTSNIFSAVTDFFKAHAGIPFVGAALAVAAIAVMMGTIGKFASRAKGGLVTSPTATIAGDAGPEVYAPENTFKDYLYSIQDDMASRAARNATYLHETDRSVKTNLYTSNSSSSSSQENNQAINIHYHGNITTLGTDTASKEALASFVHKDLDDIYNRYINR